MLKKGLKKKILHWPKYLNVHLYVSVHLYVQIQTYGFFSIYHTDIYIERERDIYIVYIYMCVRGLNILKNIQLAAESPDFKVFVDI